jgi:hypothetical protein
VVEEEEVKRGDWEQMLLDMDILEGTPEVAEVVPVVKETPVARRGQDTLVLE